MRRFLIGAIALALLGASGTNREEFLSTLFANFISESTIQPVTAVANLPPAVSAALDAYGTFPMVDPGESWNPFCIHDSSNPEPDRRLIIAALSPNLVGVHYERGGVSRHSVLELFELSQSGNVVTRCMYSSGLVAESIAELRSAFPDAFTFLHCKPSPGTTPAA